MTPATQLPLFLSALMPWPIRRPVARLSVRLCCFSCEQDKEGSRAREEGRGVLSAVVALVSFLPTMASPRHHAMLLEMLKKPGNGVCVDCRAKGALDSIHLWDEPVCFARADAGEQIPSGRPFRWVSLFASSAAAFIATLGHTFQKFGPCDWTFGPTRRARFAAFVLFFNSLLAHLCPFQSSWTTTETTRQTKSLRHTCPSFIGSRGKATQSRPPLSPFFVWRVLLTRPRRPGSVLREQFIRAKYERKEFHAESTRSSPDASSFPSAVLPLLGAFALCSRHFLPLASRSRRAS